MNYQVYCARTLLVLLLSCVACPQSLANSVGIGLGGTTQFKGSRDYKAIPMASFSIDTRIGKVSSEQIGLKIDLIESRRIDTGPIIKYQGGRDNDMSDREVAKISVVPASMEAGWYLSSGIPLKVLGLKSESILTGKISGTLDVGDGHGGNSYGVSTGLVSPVSPAVRIISSLSLNFSNKKYQQAFFGISDLDAAASELPAFKADGGLESIGLTMVAVRKISEKWSITSITSYSKLQADAAESPITKRGSDDQFFLGLVFGYQL